MRLCITTLPRGATEEELRDYCDAVLVWIDSGKASHLHAAIMDLSEVGYGALRPSHRRIFAEYELIWESHAARYTVGAALVCPSAWMRGAVVAYNWIKRPAYPQRVVANVETAKTWCRPIASLSERNF